MKLSIKNLGLIETANLEIKDLTILCGKNNTSKTYIAYLENLQNIFQLIYKMYWRSLKSMVMMKQIS